MSNKVALITGASRGIGKATALVLAKAGFDIAITARTMSAGEQHQDMLTSNGQALPGSLEETLASLRETGVKAIAVKVDLLDHSTIDQAIKQTIDTFGRIDALINNATFNGDALNTPFLETEPESMQRIFQANVFGPAYLTRQVVEQMTKQPEGGTIVSLTTGGAEYDPPMPVWEGSWGFNYGASKAAFHRLAGIINAEFREQKIKSFNLQPGVVTTEALMATLGGDSKLAEQFGSAPPEVPATVIHWLLTAPEADEYLGRTVDAQRLAKKRQIVEGWPA